jgi:hypothetical protein
MSGNPRLNKMVRQTIYDLKHQFGDEVTVYKVLDSSTNYKTGVRSIETQAYPVKKCIVLPNTMTRELYQGVSYISASKAFTSLGGMAWDQAKRGFIFEGHDLPGYTWDIEDWIVYRGKRYDVESIEALEYDSGWMVVATEVKNATSGGGPSAGIEQSIPLASQTVTDVGL